MSNTQNVQNVQNIQNIQHTAQPGQPFQIPPMPGQMNVQMTQPPQFDQSGQTPQGGAQMQQGAPQFPQGGAQTAENGAPMPQSTPMRDWSTEISPLQRAQDHGETHPTFTPIMRSELAGSSGPLDMRAHVPDEVLESPTTVSEAYLGSMKAMLTRNRGNFVVATFLIGTQGTTTWEGLLYDVGNDYLIIHQMGRDRYIACDLYSLKYIEFYDTQRKEVCDNLMWQNGWQSGC